MLQRMNEFNHTLLTLRLISYDVSYDVSYDNSSVVIYHCLILVLNLLFSLSLLTTQQQQQQATTTNNKQHFSPLDLFRHFFTVAENSDFDNAALGHEKKKGVIRS